MESFKLVKESYQHYQTLVDAEVRNLREKRSYDRQWQTKEKERIADTILGDIKKLAEISRKEFYHNTIIVSEAGMLARQIAVLSFVLTVLMVFMLSFFITRSITNPLLKLVKKTRDIQKGLFECDLDVKAPPEIAELTEAFNLMCSKLKEVEKIKSDFFSMISHELRTPITTIKEGISLLLEGACGSTTEKQGKLLTIIAAESNRLTSLVNSILDLSKIEAGMMEYHLEKRHIGPLIEQVIVEIAPYAKAKKIHLANEIDTALPLYRMDSDRVLDVLRNLIGNAVKFTPEKGQISIMAIASDEGLKVTISDSGPGIPREKLSAIFEKYVSSDQKKGTGLGLAIVKHIVEAHGGKVWAENNPEKGSRFIFILPS